MAISVPQMQTAYTGYDFGQNTARNLLDAVRMRNQRAMQERKLKSDFELQQRRLRSAEGMQNRRLRSSEGMQDKRLDQNQTQFDDDLRFRETDQDVRIESQLVADDIKKAQEERAKNLSDRDIATEDFKSDTALRTLEDNIKVDEAQKRYNEVLSNTGGNFGYKAANAIYNKLYPVYDFIDKGSLGILSGKIGNIGQGEKSLDINFGSIGSPAERASLASGSNQAVKDQKNNFLEAINSARLNPNVNVSNQYVDQIFNPQRTPLVLNQAMLNNY
tara:strand:+ start:3683 stop:4504 length:822 start_codon:yes stop_codon:yes gene_type:complete